MTDTPTTLHLTGLALREIRLPLKEPFRISSGVCTERRILLLELTDADGLSAWAECVAGELPNYSAETIDTAWHAITTWIAPRVLGRTLSGPGMTHDVLARDFRGHPMAKAAVEMGGWALTAVRAGVPLSRLLGGTRATVATGISLGIQATPEALVERAAEWRASSRHALQWAFAHGYAVERYVSDRAASRGFYLLARG